MSRIWWQFIQNLFIFFHVCQNVFIIIVVDGMCVGLSVSSHWHDFWALRSVIRPSPLSQSYVVFLQIPNHNLKDFFRKYILSYLSFSNYKYGCFRIYWPFYMADEGFRICWHFIYPKPVKVSEFICWVFFFSLSVLGLSLFLSQGVCFNNHLSLCPHLSQFKTSFYYFIGILLRYL